jgi:hypothetical protein
MHWVVFNSLNHLLRNKVVITSCVYEIIEEENTFQDNFRTFVKFMTSISNLPRDIHHSRMVLYREREHNHHGNDAHNMLTTKHLSNEYWDEAVATAIYILNICLTKSVKNRVP